MNRKPKSLVDVAESLRRAHGASGEAILVLRKVSLRGEETFENQHRLRLADAVVYEARYHLSAARSLLALGLVVDEAAAVPWPLRAFAQAAAARATMVRLDKVRSEIARELRGLAMRAGEPGWAQLEPLPPERLPLPYAEALLYGAVVSVLAGIVAWLAGLAAVGAAAMLAGGVAWFAAADAMGRR